MYMTKEEIEDFNKHKKFFRYELIFIIVLSIILLTITISIQNFKLNLYDYVAILFIFILDSVAYLGYKILK